MVKYLMKKRHVVLLSAGLIVTLSIGCRPREKSKGRYDGLDGGFTHREECDMACLDCMDRCDKRKASLACAGCCRDQEFLCDTGQKHSFEYCEGAH
jgi:hypothetical protein